MIAMRDASESLFMSGFFASPGDRRRAMVFPIAAFRRNLVMLIATGVVVSAAAGFFLLPRASAHKIDKSIAVLPFENLSDDMTEVREMTLRSPIFKRFVLTFLAMSHG